MSFEHWTLEQWAVFTVTLAAGIIAAAVLAVLRRYTAPAPLTLPDIHRVPRPSIVMTERRALAVTAPRHLPYIEPSRHVPIIVGEWTDPMAMSETDFTDPGIGSLSSIQATATDPALRTAAEISAELKSWVNAYADLSGSMPETDAVREAMRITLEPALRKAHLWRIRGEGSEQRQRLNDWRMNTPTGEYPMLTTADLRPYAAALLLAS